jgi:hypothetical protein
VSVRGPCVRAPVHQLCPPSPTSPLHISTPRLNLVTQNITEPLSVTPDTRTFRLHHVFWQQLSTTRIARPHRSPARLYHRTDVPRPLRSIRQLLWTANRPTGHAGSHRHSSCECPATAPFSHNHWPIGITRPNIALSHQPPHTNRESIQCQFRLSGREPIRGRLRSFHLGSWQQPCDPVRTTTQLRCTSNARREAG